MAWYRAGGGGIPSSLKTGMNSVLNKKFGTATTYDPAGWPDTVNLMGPLPEKTVSGEIVAFSDGADAVPLKKCEITLPASLDGYSQVNVVHGGKNFLSSAPAETKNNNSVYITCDGKGKYTATGTATGGSANITFTLKTPCEIKSGMYLHLMNSPANANASVTFQKQDNTSIYAPALSPANRIINLSSYVGQVIYSIRLYVVNNASVDLTFSPMLCYSNTATTFEPYTAPTTHTASLGRTIYGGSVDVVNGECTKAITETKTFDGSSDENWLYSSSYGWFYIDDQFGDAYRNNAENDFMACNLGTQTKYSGVITLPDMHFACTSGTNSRFAFKNSQYSTVEDFKTWLSNNNMVVAYTSATFTPFTFTPVPILSRLGNNTMWSEQGDAEVTYRADIDLALAEQASNTRTLAAPLALGRTLDATETTDENADAKEEQENELDR